MSRLPWGLPPSIGSGSLGNYQSKQMKKMYPGLRFFTGQIPDSCPSNCSTLMGRIPPTGNSYNPITSEM